jgi:chromosome segregation ATPase
LQWLPHTAKADLWSVGVLLYKMLTDDFPFPANNPRQLLERILSETPHFPPDVQLSSEMKDLLTRLLQKDESLRISWTEFFLHPCVNLSEEEISLTLSTSSVELLRELEQKEREIRQLKAENKDLKTTQEEQEKLIQEMKRNEHSLSEEINTLRAALQQRELEATQHVEELVNQHKLMFAQQIEALENVVREQQILLASSQEKDKQRKREIARLKKKLRQRPVSDSIAAAGNPTLIYSGEEGGSPRSLSPGASHRETSPSNAISSNGKKSSSRKEMEALLQQKQRELLEVEKGKEKVESELRLLQQTCKKREEEDRRVFLTKINKLKRERDQFASDAATLQVEYENLVNHVEDGVAELANEMLNTEAERNFREKQQLEVLLKDQRSRLQHQDTELTRLRQLLDKALATTSAAATGTAEHTILGSLGLSPMRSPPRSPGAERRGGSFKPRSPSPTRRPVSCASPNLHSISRK